MIFATSSRGDPRLTGGGGRVAWPWIRSVVFGLLGFAVVYPGGIAIGLACGLPPDFTPFQTYVWLGIVANLTIGLVLSLAKRRRQFYAFSSSAFAMIVVTLMLAAYHAQ